MGTSHVDLYVDPLCPWAWLTSRWLLEVEQVRPITISTKLFSLAEINRDGGSAGAKQALPAGEQALRILAQARRQAGETGIRNLYTAVGEAHHEQSKELGDIATLEGAARDAGFDASLVHAALEDATTFEEVMADHASAVQRGVFGVATLIVDDGPATFGPVVDVRIGGEEAGNLWDQLAPLLVHPHLFELKRTRTGPAGTGRARRPAAAAAR